MRFNRAFMPPATIEARSAEPAHSLCCKGALRFLNSTMSGVEISEREIGNIERGIGLRQELEIFLRILVAPRRA